MAAQTTAGAACELPRCCRLASDDRCDLFERHGKHVVQHERDAFGGRERVEHDEEGDPDRIGENHLALRVDDRRGAGGIVLVQVQRYVRP
jgi:hypothetical protein